MRSNAEFNGGIYAIRWNDLLDISSLRIKLKWSLSLFTSMSHALGCNLSLWDEQAKALSGRYRVLRYDTRGHGQTSAPSGPYSLEQMADDVHGLLNALDVAQTHFVGISMGGMIGQIFALTHPSMIRSLALSSTTSRYPTAARSAWVDRIRTVETKGMEPLVESALERW